MPAYPNTLPDLSTVCTNATPASDTHPALHNDANAEINAIAAELGTNPSGAAATVKARLEALAPEPWREVGAGGQPGFATGWSNLTGFGFETAAFSLDGLGIVRLKGVVTKGATGNVTIFTLPAGYRPAASLIQIVNGGNASNTVRRLTIAADGTVFSSVSNGDFVSLDCLSFVAA